MTQVPITVILSTEFDKEIIVHATNSIKLSIQLRSCDDPNNFSFVLFVYFVIWKMNDKFLIRRN